MWQSQFDGEFDNIYSGRSIYLFGNYTISKMCNKQLFTTKKMNYIYTIEYP